MAAVEPEVEEEQKMDHAKHDHIQSVLLLVAQVPKASKTLRRKPQLKAKLLTLFAGKWMEVSLHLELVSARARLLMPASLLRQSCGPRWSSAGC